MKLLRFDLIGGASGDMILGALLALGADAKTLEALLAKLLEHPLHLHLDPASSHGIHGQRLTVSAHHAHHEDAWQEVGHCHEHEHHHHHDHRAWKHIDAMLAASPLLSDKTRERSRAVFKALALVEAEIHGKTPDDVHFHEVGAWDSIADIVGTCWALEQLGVDAVETSAFPAGTGTLECAHGTMPNPAPATLRLLKGFPVAQTDEPFELVTPTAAALLSVLTRMLPVPQSAATRTVRSDAFSFGKRMLLARPNLLRASLCETANDAIAFPETLTLLETNLDDCNPQWLPDLVQRLLDLGANDAWITPVVMKKGRPAFVLSVLVQPALVQTVTPVIFKATTTFGIRATTVTRATLDRRFETCDTPHGPLRVKIGSLNGEDITRTPEFEDCAKLARDNHCFPRDFA